MFLTIVTTLAPCDFLSIFMQKLAAKLSTIIRSAQLLGASPQTLTRGSAPGQCWGTPTSVPRTHGPLPQSSQ